MHAAFHKRYENGYSDAAGGMKGARMVLRYDFQPNMVTYNMVSSSDLKGFTRSAIRSSTTATAHTPCRWKLI